MQLFPLVCNNLSTPPPLPFEPLSASQGLERYQKTLKRTVMASTAPNVHCPESTCFTRENLLLRLQVLQEKVQRQLDQSGAAQDLRSIVEQFENCSNKIHKSRTELQRCLYSMSCHLDDSDVDFQESAGEVSKEAKASVEKPKLKDEVEELLEEVEAFEKASSLPSEAVEEVETTGTAASPHCEHRVESESNSSPSMSQKAKSPRSEKSKSRLLRWARYKPGK